MTGPPNESGGAGTPPRDRKANSKSAASVTQFPVSQRNHPDILAYRQQRSVSDFSRVIQGVLTPMNKLGGRPTAPVPQCRLVAVPYFLEKSNVTFIRSNVSVEISVVR